MKSIISKHYDFNGRSVIRLNALQKKQVELFQDKIRRQEYVFEDTPCPCGEERFEVIATRDRFGLFVQNVICIRCGLIRINPRLTQKSYQRFYETEYRKLYTGQEGESNIAGIFKAQYETGKDIYSFLKNQAPLNVSRKLDVVEVGCSAGGILKYFSDQGHKTMGVDYDRDYIRYGVEKNGLDLRHGDVDSLQDEKLDLMILSHVFEHLTEPLSFIQKAAEIIREGGGLLINVPGIKYDFYYERCPFDFLFYLQNAHAYTYTLGTLNNLFVGTRFWLAQGNENVRALFILGEMENPQVVSRESYHEITAFLRHVESQRNQKWLVYHLLKVPKRWVVKFIERIGLKNFLKSLYAKSHQMAS